MSHLPPLRIFSNLPRSGGTLIGRCLGCMESVLLLSEIHPLGAAVDRRFDPLFQACYWHKLLIPEAAAAPCPIFADVIEMVADKCTERGLQLVIRDWAYLDYMGLPYNPSPSGCSQLGELLSPRFTILQYHLVRHPLEQWLSICGGRIVKRYLSVEDYLEGYLCYARAASTAGFMRYEDFLRNPMEQLATLCHHLQLDFDTTFMEKWCSYRKITGDNRSINQKDAVIRPYKQKMVPPQLLSQFRASSAYREALQLLGYSSWYDCWQE